MSLRQKTFVIKEEVFSVTLFSSYFFHTKSINCCLVYLLSCLPLAGCYTTTKKFQSYVGITLSICLPKTVCLSVHNSISCEQISTLYVILYYLFFHFESFCNFHNLHKNILKGKLSQRIKINLKQSSSYIVYLIKTPFFNMTTDFIQLDVWNMMIFYRLP